MTGPLSRRLADQRVVICAGAGGVGKTSVSAAVGLGLAAEGRRVAVVTIDPARRLAEALGLEQLGNQPRIVDVARLDAAGFEVRGELSAMMLDPKRTFDELIALLAPNPETRENILSNRIYQYQSTAIAGSQEYAAITKLSQLGREGRYDEIVVDTPPSRSAMEFLHAPTRLLRFLEDGRMRAFLSPTGQAARAAGVVFAVLRRITGISLLGELTAFFQSLSGVIDGFRSSASDIEALLSDPITGFLIITSPERVPLEEAIQFADELDRIKERRRGVVVNRVHRLDPQDGCVDRTTSRLEPALGRRLAERVARAHENVQRLAHRDHAALQRLRSALDEPELFCVTERASDLQDIRGLVSLHDELFGITVPRRTSSPLSEEDPNRRVVADDSYRSDDDSTLRSSSV